MRHTLVFPLQSDMMPILLTMSHLIHIGDSVVSIQHLDMEYICP